ncbi:MAG: 2-oxoglutarate and iron-dependent oxygenase domain-containing protein [Pirellulaceae bacterium]|nr:isopenicillin N synthase family oxygenase [Planctomycetaceae bacterium]
MTHPLPIVDVSSLVAGFGSRENEVAEQIGDACREHGFFYVVGHGVDAALQNRLEALSREFFALPPDFKMAIRMKLAGRAWRGYFPVGAELTSGQPDKKEGLYFGAELDDHHPKVVARVPLHGRNLFPDVSEFRDTVLDYMAAMTRLGHTLMRGIALSLGLDASYFADSYTGDPFILFRVFHYPPITIASDAEWSVGEHTDYGLITLLRQDDVGGLQVKLQSQWLDARPIPNSFVCNIGDMLDQMTGGLYCSTPHRVRNVSGAARLSFPFFFDPNFDAPIRPIVGLTSHAESAEAGKPRWDGLDVHGFSGTYGDYLLSKVARVFPDLG